MLILALLILGCNTFAQVQILKPISACSYEHNAIRELYKTKGLVKFVINDDNRNILLVEENDTIKGYVCNNYHDISDSVIIMNDKNMYPISAVDFYLVKMKNSSFLLIFTKIGTVLNDEIYEDLQIHIVHANDLQRYQRFRIALSDLGVKYFNGKVEYYANEIEDEPYIEDVRLAFFRKNASLLYLFVYKERQYRNRDVGIMEKITIKDTADFNKWNKKIEQDKIDDLLLLNHSNIIKPIMD